MAKTETAKQNKKQRDRQGQGEEKNIETGTQKKERKKKKEGRKKERRIKLGERRSQDRNRRSRQPISSFALILLLLFTARARAPSHTYRNSSSPVCRRLICAFWSIALVVAGSNVKAAASCLALVGLDASVATVCARQHGHARARRRQTRMYKRHKRE